MASIRKRGDTFTITAYMGYDDKGRQRKKTTTFRPPDNVTPGKAEKLAKQYAAVWEEKIRGYVALDENRTLSELAEWYYTTVAPSVLKPQTLINYRGEIERHVLPAIGREKLKNITPPMLDSLFAELQRNGNTETHYRLKDKALLDGFKRQTLADKAGIEKSTLYNAIKGTSRRDTAEKIAAAIGMPLDKAFDNESEQGLSGATVNKIKLNLSAIFTAAVKKEIMRRNPCKLATPPKVDTAPAEFLDEQESKRFLAALHEQSDFQFEVICNLFLATGMRSGELCALYWDDIDLDTGLLYIQHTLIREKGGIFHRDKPKTPESERRIVLPPYIIDLLKEHKRKQAINRFAAGVVWKVPDLVFTNTVGNYLIGANLNVKLKRVCKAARLPAIHLHTLRHTHASLLINGNVAARVIADRLGHSTTKTTLDTYSHVFAESEARAMQAIDMALFRDTEHDKEKDVPNSTPLRMVK